MTGILSILTITACLTVSPVIFEDPDPDEANAPLKSVSRRESYVFASTSTGIFRASVVTKRWERLKTPTEMCLGGAFAVQSGPSPLVVYVAKRTRENSTNQTSPSSLRYGLYISRDDGLTWELTCERNDFGAVLLLTDGTLFAVAGADALNSGNRLLRSSDMGKTWRDISGNASAVFTDLEPDPKHSGLVRVRGWDQRGDVTLLADDEDYEWKRTRWHDRKVGELASGDFFERSSSSTNRMHLLRATLSYWFRYNFGNHRQVQALEVVPLESRLEFARDARVAVPIRVVLHDDFEGDLIRWRKNQAAGRQSAQPTLFSEKIADQPTGIDFWGVRVESAAGQFEKNPAVPNLHIVTQTIQKTANGSITRKTSRPAEIKYQVIDVSPIKPYLRDLDLGLLADFSKPGEYRVQILYASGGQAKRDENVWDGHLTSPVFTVVIRE